MSAAELPSLASADALAPETLGQARTWETIKSQHLALGLCHRCAALAAWGHQLGHVDLDEPCATCALIVARFALPAAGAWRKAERDSLRSNAILSSALGGARGPAGASDNRNLVQKVVAA